MRARPKDEQKLEDLVHGFIGHIDFKQALDNAFRFALLEAKRLRYDKHSPEFRTLCLFRRTQYFQEIYTKIDNQNWNKNYYLGISAISDEEIERRLDKMYEGEHGED